MKKYKLTPYTLLLIATGISVTSYALAEEQLSEIKVTDEMSSTTHTQTQPAVIQVIALVLALMVFLFLILKKTLFTLVMVTLIALV